MDFEIYLDVTEVEGGYIATFSELPDFVLQRSTIEELMLDLEDAIMEWFEANGTSANSLSWEEDDF